MATTNYGAKRLSKVDLNRDNAKSKLLRVVDERNTFYRAETTQFHFKFQVVKAVFPVTTQAGTEERKEPVEWTVQLVGRKSIT